MTVELHLEGGVELTSRLRGIGDRASDLRPIWGRLKERFTAAEAATFASQGGASGQWAPLSPAYARWKAQHYPGQTILRATDTLYRSLTDDLSIDIREPHMMVLGSDVKHGRYHQSGTGRMPLRRLIDLSQYEKRTWASLIRSFIFGTGTASSGEAA